MLSLVPAQVIDDVIYRHAGYRRPRLGRGSRKETKIHIVASSSPVAAEALPDVSVANIVDQVRSNRPGIAACNSLGIVLAQVLRRLPRKLYRIARASVVLLQVSPHKDSVLVGGYVVDSSNRCILVDRVRR